MMAQPDLFEQYRINPVSDVTLTTGQRFEKNFGGRARFRRTGSHSHSTTITRPCMRGRFRKKALCSGRC